MILTTLAAAGLILAADAAQATPEALARGRDLAQTHCAQCHAVDTKGRSRHRGAPVFRKLHQRYDVANLEEALGEGIVTGHPDMPEILLQPEEVTDFIAYLQSIQTRR